MDEIIRFCPSCGCDREAREIVRDDQGEVIKLECGHSIIADVFTDVVHFTDEFSDMHKRFNSDRKLEWKAKSKKSGETKLPARERFVIDRARGMTIHMLEEFEDGEWVQRHFHENSFKKKNTT